MTQDLNRRKIANLLETLVEQFQSMSNHKSPIPRIETDLMLSNIRSLYESVIDLEKLNTQKTELKPVLEVVSDSENKISETISPIQETEERDNTIIMPDFKAEISENNSLETHQNHDIKTEIYTNEPETEIAETNLVLENEVENTENNSVNESISIDSKATKPLEAPVLPGLFDDLPLTKVEEKSQMEHEISIMSNHIKTEKKPASSSTIIEKAHKKPISNLSSAIGINDKYAFINELFKGNSETYHSVIQDINNSLSKESADIIVNPLETKYNWNKESRVYIAFMELIERRFLPQ